jgi:hypothetical protein
LTPDHPLIPLEHLGVLQLVVEQAQHTREKIELQQDIEMQHHEHRRCRAVEGQQWHLDAQQRQLDRAGHQELQVRSCPNDDREIEADGEEGDPECKRLPASLICCFE